MSLPAGFIDELRNRCSVVSIIGRKVAWDTRKSNPGKGEMWAQCPFHQEKTASFKADDSKGAYYCFGCHEKGDVFGFVQKTENVGFMEAIEILAREAGMQMPAPDPQAREKADRRSQLIAVMETAVQYFRMQLNTCAAREVREYLTKRGLDQAVIDKFEIGFAPDGWQNLWDHLQSKNISDDLILACGLAKKSNSGKRPYDTFRNRIMFPIRDARGQAIAFGGRAVDANDPAKYLNSPETELFDKGRSLYNLAPARAALGKGAPLLVAEGYMDVIALSEAGFGGTVAPLGTAITESQLQLLWRVADEPIIALDGDKAGIKAAYRLMDMAFPLLSAGKTLRFAMMPQGQDPDDVIRAGGAATVKKLIDDAGPMVDLLWKRETDGKTFDSPERKAALDIALNTWVNRIGDTNMRKHYNDALYQLKRNLFWKPMRKGTAPKKGRKPIAQNAQLETKGSPLASQSISPRTMGEALIIASIYKTPSIHLAIEDMLEGFECQDQNFEGMRRFIMGYTGQSDELPAQMQQFFGAAALENLLALNHVQSMPSIRRAGDEDFVAKCVKEVIAKITTQEAHTAEVENAASDFSDVEDEKLTWLLTQSAQSVTKLGKSADADTTEFAVSKSGAKVKVDEQSKFAELIDKIDFVKRKH